MSYYIRLLRDDEFMREGDYFIDMKNTFHKIDPIPQSLWKKKVDGIIVFRNEHQARPTALPDSKLSELIDYKVRFKQTHSHLDMLMSATTNHNQRDAIQKIKDILDGNK